MARTPAIPAPGAQIVLRPHSIGATLVEALAALVGVFVVIDAITGRAWLWAVGGTVWTVVFLALSVLGRRRRTTVGPGGVDVQDWWRRRRLTWDEVAGFELVEHRTGGRDHLAVRSTDGELTALPHQDAGALAVRPAAARTWYLALLERLEDVRRMAGYS
jgi:Bacterial PH domain